MKIWAHMMVKNEFRWLWYSANSIVDYVDKLLLWDTGSTDGTLDIIHRLLLRYPDKIEFKSFPQNSIHEFTAARQAMLDATESDWFLTVDGDEIWWKDSIRLLTDTIRKNGTRYETLIVPTLNLIGDVYHIQDSSAGKYKFGSKTGHYNLRAINRNIPGLKSQGVHGVWGWADENNIMIQDRAEDKMLFINAPYLHATFLQRAGSTFKNKTVPKRSKKLKYEIGQNLPLDFYFPEVFFEDKPDLIYCPWKVCGLNYKFMAAFVTPFKKIKRRIWTGKAGY